MSSRRPTTTPAAQFPADPFERALRDAVFAALRRARAVQAGADVHYGRWPIPRYDGGTDTQGRSYVSIWPQFAALARGRGIARPATLAEALVASAYEADVAAGAPMRPDHLLRREVLAGLDRALAAWVVDPAQAVAEAIAVFRQAVAVRVRCRGLEARAAASAVVADPATGWGPLARCCLAHAAGVPPPPGCLAAARREAAADPAAVAAWGVMVPEAVRAGVGDGELR